LDRPEARSADRAAPRGSCRAGRVEQPFTGARQPLRPRPALPGLSHRSERAYVGVGSGDSVLLAFKPLLQSNAPTALGFVGADTLECRAGSTGSIANSGF